MKTRTPTTTRRYAGRKTKDTLPWWQSDGHLSSPRACRQTGTTWRQQDSCSTPCSARLSFLQCGYTQRTGHTGFPQTHWRNWRGDAATCSILKSGSQERIFCCGALSVHSCLSPSVESPPKCGVWCGRQRSGENMKCCVLMIKILLWLMIIIRELSSCLLKSEAPGDRLRADEKFTGLRYFGLNTDMNWRYFKGAKKLNLSSRLTKT